MEFLLLVVLCNVAGMGLYHTVVCVGKLKQDGWVYDYAKLFRTAIAGVLQVVLCLIFPWRDALNLEFGTPTYQFLWLSVLAGCGAAVLIDHGFKICGWRIK